MQILEVVQLQTDTTQLREIIWPSVPEKTRSKAVIAPPQQIELHSNAPWTRTAMQDIEFASGQSAGIPRIMQPTIGAKVCFGSLLLKEDFQGGLQAILIQDKLRTRNFGSKNRSR